MERFYIYHTFFLLYIIYNDRKKLIYKSLLLFQAVINNIHICIAPYGRNFRGAGPGSVLVGVRRGKRVSLGEEKCL